MEPQTPVINSTGIPANPVLPVEPVNPKPNFAKKLYSGRIGSLAYFAGNLISWGGSWLINESGKVIPSGTFINIIKIVLYLLLVLLMVSTFVRRLHDLNKSGWLSLLMFVPLANLILGAILLFKPGSHKVNRFGPPSQGGKFIFKELFAM